MDTLLAAPAAPCKHAGCKGSSPIARCEGLLEVEQSAQRSTRGELRAHQLCADCRPAPRMHALPPHSRPDDACYPLLHPLHDVRAVQGRGAAGHRAWCLRGVRRQPARGVERGPDRPGLSNLQDLILHRRSRSHARASAVVLRRLAAQSVDRWAPRRGGALPIGVHSFERCTGATASRACNGRALGSSAGTTRAPHGRQGRRTAQVPPNTGFGT